MNPGGYFAYREGARVSHVVPAQRTTWKYFVHRCLVEGAAKAALTAIAGSDGLGTENRYVREVLPRAVIRALLTGAPRRALAIVAGFSLTAFAYAKVRLQGVQTDDDASSAGAASPVTEAPALPTKGIAE
jgi:hypothetical protein